MIYLGDEEDIIDPHRYYEQHNISKDSFFSIRDTEETSHRKIFNKFSGIQKNKERPTFSVSFGETIVPIYETMTQNKLIYSTRHKNFWHYLPDKAAIRKVEAWEQQQNLRVFLKDNLFSSIALDLYEDKTKQRPATAFYYLKYARISGEAYKKTLTWTANEFVRTIQSLPFYKDCKYISAVPPRPGKKGLDLPALLATEISKKLIIEDITSTFQYTGEKAQGKTLSRDDKWAAWETAGLSCTKDLEGKDVILIDDLYQSGISVNFVGMKLQEANCGKICGLYIVKSLNDKDNIQRTPGSE